MIDKQSEKNTLALAENDFNDLCHDTGPRVPKYVLTDDSRAASKQSEGNP